MQNKDVFLLHWKAVIRSDQRQDIKLWTHNFIHHKAWRNESPQARVVKEFNFRVFFFSHPCIQRPKKINLLHLKMWIIAFHQAPHRSDSSVAGMEEVVVNMFRLLVKAERLQILPSQQEPAHYYSIYKDVWVWELNCHSDWAMRQLNAYIRTASSSPEGTRGKPPRTIGLLDEWLYIPLCKRRSAETKGEVMKSFCLFYHFLSWRWHLHINQ